MISKEYCEKCKKETEHEIEEIRNCDNGGGYPHNDDVLTGYTCEECFNYYEEL